MYNVTFYTDSQKKNTYVSFIHLDIGSAGNSNLI